MHGKHVGLTSVPHGAKSYLAAALALEASGERVCWVARDAEIGDRVAEELGAWLGDPSLVAILEPRTSLAYERSELVPDETAARVAALAAWRAGTARVLVASVQALLQATLGPDDLPAQPRTLKAGTRIGMDALLAELLERGYAPVLEVAGRGEFARRGGIVDVFPPSATAADPDRVLRRRDRQPPRLRPDRPALRRDGARPHPAARDRVPAAARWRGRVPVPARAARVQAAGAAGARPRPVRGRRGPGATGHDGDRRPRARRRRRGRGLGPARGAVDRPRPPRPRHAPRARRAGRPRRCRCLPVAPGRRAAHRARGAGRAAARLADARSCPRSTGSGGSTARGRWSSRGSPRRSMRRAWRTRRRA